MNGRRCSGKLKGPESPKPKVSSFRMDVIPSPVPAEEKGATNPRDHYAWLVVPLAGKILITFQQAGFITHIRS